MPPQRKHPIGIQDFKKPISEKFVYVDKTDLVYKLVNSGTSYFLSRPRRFGKSLLISTLKACFEGQKELFKGVAIEKLETEWTQYPVLETDRLLIRKPLSCWRASDVVAKVAENEKL